MIASFSDPSTILKLSMGNKKLQSTLDPTNNSFINTSYRETVHKKFFDPDNFEKNIFLNKEKNEEKDNLIDDYEISKINWLKVLNKMNENQKKIGTIKEKENEIFNYCEFVYQFLENHCYLPDLRRSIRNLEYPNGSCLLNYFYDSISKSKIMFYHYDKFIKEDEEKIENYVELYKKKKLPFDQELSEFKIFLQSIKQNYEYVEIIKIIYNMDYNKLVELYENNKNIEINNRFILFFLWLVDTFYVFIYFLYGYILKFKNASDDKAMIYEFNDKHNALVNFALLVNERFENVNFLINYLYQFLHKSNKKNRNKSCSRKFSLVKFILKMEKEILFNPLKETLNNKFRNSLEEYFKENLFNLNNNNNNEKEEKEESKKKNYLRGSNLSTEYGSYNMEVEMEENEKKDYELIVEEGLMEMEKNYLLEIDEEEDIESNKKEVLESYFNSVLDFSLNGKNGNLINHSDIKLKAEYEEIESIFIDTLIKEIRNYLQETQNLNEVFKIIKSLTDNSKYIDPSSYKMFRLNFISRTKEKILYFLLKDLKNDINDGLKNEIQLYINDYSKNILNNLKNVFDSKQQSGNEILNMSNIYSQIKEEGQKKMNEQKEKMIKFLENVIDDYDKEKKIKVEKEFLINNYLYGNNENKINKIGTFMREIIIYYYQENVSFANDNYIVEDLLKNNKRFIYEHRHNNLIKTSDKDKKEKTSQVNSYEDLEKIESMNNNMKDFEKDTLIFFP